jgi:hypothetical protein
MQIKKEEIKYLDIVINLCIRKDYICSPRLQSYIDFILENKELNDNYATKIYFLKYCAILEMAKCGKFIDVAEERLFISKENILYLESIGGAKVIYNEEENKKKKEKFNKYLSITAIVVSIIALFKNFLN